MKTRILILVLRLSILMIFFSGLKVNQAYNTIPTIYYNGRNKEIVFLNMKVQDMFIELKELMPGDKKEQEVLFKADNIKKICSN